MERLKPTSERVRRTLASVARQERTALRIYRDISGLRSNVDCLSSKINAHLARITRLQEEHQRVIDSIALKKAVLTKWAYSPEMMVITGTKSPERTTQPLPEVEPDLRCFESLSPEHTLFLDTISCAIGLPSRNLSNELPFDVSGIMDFQELENLGWLTDDIPTPTSKIPSPSGGTDTCLNESASLTILGKGE